MMPSSINLATLLEYYFRVIDPTSLNRQGNDRGVQYRTGIYYTDVRQNRLLMRAMAREQQKWQQPCC